MECVETFEAQQVKIGTSLLDLLSERGEERRVVQKMKNAIPPCLIGDAVDLEMHHTAGSEGELAADHALKDGENRSSFHLDASLRLGVVRTVQAAGIQIEKHEAGGGMVMELKVIC
jgi:hypothetical protein